MNVQRCTDGKLRPAVFPKVLGLPYPVARIVKVVPTNSDPNIQQSFSIHVLVTDTESTDFHGQRMTVVR